MFVVSDEDDVDGMQDAGVALVRAYNYIRDELDSQSAFEAVISVGRPQGRKKLPKDLQDLYPDIPCLFVSSLDVQPDPSWRNSERFERGEGAGEELPLRGGQQHPGCRLQLRHQQEGKRGG